jgi:hypothetical protein
MQHINDFIKIKKAFYSTPELVAYLRDYAGMKITKSTVFKWSMSGKIPCRKAPNGRLLFPVDAVQKWLIGNSENMEAM